MSPIQSKKESVKTEGIKILRGNNVKNLDEEVNYKYLGTIHADIFNQTEVQMEVRNEYI